MFFSHHLVGATLILLVPRLAIGDPTQSHLEPDQRPVRPRWYQPKLLRRGVRVLIRCALVYPVIFVTSAIVVSLDFGYSLTSFLQRPSGEMVCAPPGFLTFGLLLIAVIISFVVGNTISRVGLAADAPEWVKGATNYDDLYPHLSLCWRSCWFMSLPLACIGFPAWRA